MAASKFILAALLLGAPLPAIAQAMPGAVPLAEDRLDALRGGFDLPGGGTVSLGVATETRVNGQEVLRTVFNVNSGVAALLVLARQPGAGELTPVGAAVGGGGVATADGTVTLVALPNGVRVELAGDRLDVSHLVGQAFGSVVANSADDRAIDVATTVNISLSGVTRDAIGASGARVEGLALDATSRLSR
jgi:hypothetical protein